MRRGDVVTVVLSGDYGKPRPAIVAQDDELAGVESVLICPMTSHQGMHADFRPRIDPTPENGLSQVSFAMTDKTTAVPRTRCGAVIGHADARVMAALDESLVFVLGLAR